MTVEAAIARYIADRVRRGIAPDTVRSMRESLRDFSALVGALPTAELAERHILEWLKGQQSRRKPATVRKDFIYVRAFCRWMVNQKHARAEATANVPMPKKPRQVPRPVAEPDVTTVMGSLPDARALLILSLMAQEGLRRKEVAELELADIDFSARSMVVTGKGDHERHVPMTDETWDLMSAYLRAFPAKCGPLIRSYKRPHHPLTRETVGAYVAQWSRAAGVDVSGHQYRHTAGTAVLRGSGGNLRVAQQFLGHSSPASTAIYTLVETSDLRAAMANRSYRPRPATESPPAEEDGGLRLAA